MKATVITIILSLMIAASQQSARRAAQDIGINMPQALELLDFVEQKFHDLQSQLATEKRLLIRSNFQVDPATITAGIGAITAGIDAVDKAVTLYDKFFNKFFDTSAVKAASEYMSNKAGEMYKVDTDETLKALNMISSSMITLVDVRNQISNMMDICIDGVDVVTGIYDQLAAQPNLTDEQKIKAFIVSVDKLDKTLETALGIVSGSRARLVKVSTDMDLLTNSFEVLMNKFNHAKQDSSDYMTKQLDEFKHEKMILCIEVCGVSVLVGPLVLPICATCIAINYNGVIPKEEARLRAQLDAVSKDFDGFVASFATYKQTSINIKTQTDSEIVALDEWKKDVDIMRNRITQYKDLVKLIPATITKIRDSVASMKVSCQKLKEKFLATDDKKVSFMAMIA